MICSKKDGLGFVHEATIMPALHERGVQPLSGEWKFILNELRLRKGWRIEIWLGNWG